MAHLQHFNEDVASVLEQFIENVANLPAELQHLYEEMNSKDKRIHQLRTNINQKDASIQRFLRANGTLVVYPKETAYTKSIHETFTEIKVVQDEKIQLAKKAQSLIDRHIKRLDVKIKDLQRENLLPKDFITSEMLQQLAPPIPSNAVSLNAPGKLAPAISARPGERQTTQSVLAGATASLREENAVVDSVKKAVNGGGLSAQDMKRRRLNTGASVPVNPSPLANSGVNTPVRDGNGPRTGPNSAARRSGPPPLQKQAIRRPAVVRKNSNEEVEEEDEEDASGTGEEDEEDAGDDQRPYCTCNQVSFGNMVACDNKDCPFEWFHWGKFRNILSVARWALLG